MMRLVENNSFVVNQMRSSDINEEIQNGMQKMNHPEWQKRKQSAEMLIAVLSSNGEAKINSTVLMEFLNTLKIRIADPNKNIIKYFIQLTGLVFQNMSEKDIKNNAKNFISLLIDGLSDKVEANRKQISASINRIGNVWGR